MEQKKFIDIDKIMQNKAASIYKWLPRFVINWFRKTLHEDDINFCMNKLKDEHGLTFNSKVLEHLGADIKAFNTELIPKSGSVVIAANHPLGGLDGMSLIKVVGDVREDVRFFVNDVLKNIKNFGEIFVAVNKTGSSSQGALRTMEEVFRTECALLFFPAGLVSRKENGVVKDLRWKKSFVTQAIDHKRMIQPVFIEGENSKFFYNFALWRKKLGIKPNIEMMYLPDEMFTAKKKSIKIHFSKPFDSALLDSSKTHQKWADTIYKFIYSPEFMKGISFEEYIKTTSI